ncbi:MAG TPA: flagellar basal-body MS-ring/collar protein FliF [Candidatus Acidoferrum sp.]|jgi:flagellar M-ring protein FliF|nr:flagellar basal-body MS-ring/collar protein FliF [Candidatus Acidoferrum sp.]
MDKVLRQITAFLKGLTLGQRVFLGGSAVAVGAILWLFVHLLDNGDYKPLYSGMAPADAQNLAQRLGAENIAYQISADGATVLVRSDQLDRARVEAASQGPIASGRMGFELFDKPNWSGSDFSEKVNYQRALEAELERTIGTMNGVEAVRVHLVLPRESLFSDRERPPKAAVVLKLRGARLNDQLAASVANLVSSAWDDLSPQNVTVVTTDGQMENSGHSGSPLAPASQELEATLAERVVQTLAPVVGADHVKSSVTIEYDPTSGESTQELYDPNNTVVLSSQTSQETVGELEPAGIPGTPSNTPNSQGKTAAVSQAKGATSTQGIRSETKTYAVSHTTRHVLEPAGRIKRVAAAILVDDATETKSENGKTEQTRRKRTPEEMKQIADLAKAAVGFDAQRGDLFSLQNVAFEPAPAEAPAVPTRVQRILTFAERWTGLLRYLVLLLLFAVVYALILRPIKNRVVHLLKMPAAPLLSGTGTLEAGGIPLAQSGAAAGLPSESGGLPPEIQKAVAMRKDLAARVKDDPESASRLLQNWINEGAQRR